MTCKDPKDIETTWDAVVWIISQPIVRLVALTALAFDTMAVIFILWKG